MRLQPDIREFFIEGSDDLASHALLHITEPSTPEEEKRGYFFAVAEVENGAAEHIEQLQELVDDIETGYYAGAARGAEPFEAALESANRKGQRLLDGADMELHCLVGVVRGTQILLSSHGAPTALLFYRAKDGLGHVDILSGGDTGERHLFSALMQGSMNPGDFLFVATPGVSAHFSADRAKKILLSRGAQDSVAHMEKVLSDLKSAASFAGIVVSAPEKSPLTMPVPDPEPQKQVAPADSVVHMAHTEETTRDLLSPSLFGDVRKKIDSFFSARAGDPGEPGDTAIAAPPEEETNIRPRKEARGGMRMNSILIALGRAIVVGTLGILEALKQLVSAIGRIGVSLFYMLTNRRNKRREVAAAWKRSLQYKRAAFRSLPAATKWIGMFGIILIAAFAGSLGYLRVAKARDAAAAAFREGAAHILVLKEEADAKLIYGNESEAFSILAQASASLSGLSSQSAEEKKTLSDLEAGLEESRKKIRKMRTVAPKKVADIAAIRPEAKPEKLALVDGTLLAYGSLDAALYTVSTATGTAEPVDHSTIPALRAASVPKERDRVVFASEKKSLAAYDAKSGAVQPLDVSFPNADADIADLSVYSQRLYTLDAGGGHIYKHVKTTTGYDKGAVWDKPGAEDALRGATSFAIDGDVYVMNGGAIHKFTSGVREPFRIANLDPALGAGASSIWTYADVPALYVLESAGKRVIAADKSGKLLAQYTAAEWKNPTGMAVDAEKKTIYILDGTAIYSFGM